MLDGRYNASLAERPTLVFGFAVSRPITDRCEDRRLTHYAPAWLNPKRGGVRLGLTSQGEATTKAEPTTIGRFFKRSSEIQTLV